jgi:hypothetical protein
VNAVKWIDTYKKIVMVIMAGLLGLILYLSLAIHQHYRTGGDKAVNAMADYPLLSPTPTRFLDLSPTPTPLSPATNTPTATQTPSPTATPTPLATNPLTGLTVENPLLLERRPVMIKVSNWPATGRPHAGLSAADIVFEYYIGYAKSRFLALYYAEDSSKIGPVRSGRMVDPQLTNLFGGILGYGNADPKVDAVILPGLGDRALAFKYLPCPPMCGVDTHDATGVFADSAAMTAYAVQQGVNNDQPDLFGFHFHPVPPDNGHPGTIITFRFASWSLTEWRYDPDSGKYLWWMEDNQNGNLIMEPMPDRNTGLQIAMDNVIVIFARYIEYAPTLHDIQISTVKTPQQALFFRDGLAVEGTWHVPDPNAPMVFQSLDGTPFDLKPGKTWIFIAGMHTQIHQENAWLFDFSLP